MTFNQWIRNQVDRAGRISHLAHDIVHDPTWPSKVKDPYMLYSYLIHENAIDAALEIFEEAYNQYQNESVPHNKQNFFSSDKYDDIKNYYLYLKKYHPDEFTDSHERILSQYNAAVSTPPMYDNEDILFIDQFESTNGNELSVTDKESPSRAIYIIKADKFVKIGISNDISKRVTSLQSGCPFPINVIANINLENASEIEKSLHRIYRKHCVRGEWFVLSEPMIVSLLQFLKSLGQNKS